MLLENDSPLPLEERVRALLQRLGIQRAHVAGRTTLDFAGLVAKHPEMVASLTLVCPGGLNAAAIGPITSRTLVFLPDKGQGIDQTREALSGSPVKIVDLAGYVMTYTSEVIADRGPDILSALADFTAEVDSVPPAKLPRDEGEVAGITYRVQGEGPPLLLLPLGLVPSQWEPLLPELCRNFTTITIGGTMLGMTLILETRGRSAGYSGVIRRLAEEVEIRPGERVLDVGCGSAVVSRWLARNTVAGHVTGIDINGYLLREGRALALKEGLEGRLDLSSGAAADIPFPDNSFDVVLSSTVMEELDAGRMLSEMVRVAKSGGRIGVVVRAIDIPVVVNVRLSDRLREKVRTSPPFGGKEENGCADMSLYGRFLNAGLARVRMFPMLGSVTPADEPYFSLVQGGILSALTPEETLEWRDSLARSRADGDAFIATPYHCAVGTKPQEISPRAARAEALEA